MRHIFKILKSVIVIMIAITAVSFVSAATWNGPSAPFPNGNVDAPVNTGSTTQVKTGILTVDGFGSFGSGFFSTTTYTLPTSLMLGINGKVGAKEYCDESGESCSSAKSIDASNVVYLNPQEDRYTINETITWTTANNIQNKYGAGARTAVNGPDAVVFTPQMQTETRPIRGLIFDYRASLTSISCAADNRWYRFDINVVEIPPTAAPAARTYATANMGIGDYFFAVDDPYNTCDPGIDNSLGNVVGQNLTLISSQDISNVGAGWYLDSYFRSYNLELNPPATLKVNIVYTLVGYITD
jgi:hypothetical protein